MAYGDKYGRVLALLLLCPVLPGFAQQAPLTVDSERFHAPAATATALAKRLAQPSADALAVRLPPLSESERQALAGYVQSSAKKHPVGLGRSLPAPFRQALDPAALEWIRLADGGQAATLTVTSPGAAALRLKLNFYTLVDGLELRFYNPQLDTPQRGAAGKAASSYWSPVVEGATLTVELYLPAGSSPSELRVSAPLVSHLALAPRAGLGKDLSDIGRAGSCNIDIACAPEIPDALVDSVAKYIVTDSSGGSFLCTGTLLNDTDPNTQIPYLLTANHCVDRQSVADTMELYWFFQRATCGGPAPNSVIQQSGGAALLAHGTSTDYALLRLNRSPPDGVTLAGWSREPVAAGSTVFGIHHPEGDLKKISFGDAPGFEVAELGLDGPVSSIVTQWSEGVTEPGSSGSGLWLDNANPLLVGQLAGGRSSCAQSQAPDYYGRFDQSFAALAPWLSPSANQPPGTARLLNLSVNGRVTERELIAGFIITGGPVRVALMGENMGNLSDPVLVLTDLSGNLIERNDNWREHPTAAEISTALRPLGADSDAGFAITLAPGPYLARLSDRNGAVGNGLLSVTELPP